MVQTGYCNEDDDDDDDDDDNDVELKFGYCNTDALLFFSI